MIIVKLIISIILVLLLAEVSKRVNPLLGGMLSGLPLGAGLSVYFVSFSEGIEFMMNGIPWAIAGLASSLLFCLFYLLADRWLKSNYLILSILVSSLLGFIAFFLCGFGIYSLDLNLLLALVIFGSVFALNLIIVNRLKIEYTLKKDKKRVDTIWLILFRGLVVGIIISIITGVASIVGSKWTGILSSFPSTLFALLLVLHFEEKDRLYPSVIYGFSYSVTTLVVFYLSCLYFLPKVGLNTGFIIVYLISFLYLYLFNKLKSANLHKKVQSNELS